MQRLFDHLRVNVVTGQPDVAIGIDRAQVKSAVFNRQARVSVDDHREQARSYRGCDVSP